MSWLEPTDIVVVTGGSGGLGASILKEFALKGCQTVSLDIESTKTEEIDENPEKDATKGSNPKVSESSTSLPDANLSETQTSGNANCEPDASSTQNSLSSQNLSQNVPNANGSSSPVESASLREHSAQEDSQKRECDNATSSGDESEGNLKPTLCIQCDVRSTSDLQKARDVIFSTFNRAPSILVLNAAIRGPLNSIVESSYEELDATIDVNLSGVFKCLRTFLPDFIKNERGFIVTIASALGIVVPKGLGTYGASKAALIGLHESLTQEIADYHDVRALLVCPGQLDTKMFSDVITPSEYLAPVVSPQKLAKKIVKRVKKANTSTVYSPTYVRYLPVMNALPVCFARLARKLSGVDKVYDDMVASRVQTSEDASSAADDTSDLILSHEEAEILSSSENMPEFSHSLSNPSENTLCHTSVEDCNDPVNSKSSTKIDISTSSG